MLCTNKQRRQLIKTGDPGMVKAICECAKNVLNANVPLKPKTKNALRRYRRHLRELASKVGKTESKRRKLLKLKGGFLPLLLGPALSVIGGLIGKALKL